MGAMLALGMPPIIWTDGAKQLRNFQNMALRFALILL
jgi:hypothetical protein